MLKRVLSIVAQGGTHTRRELAQRLDVSEELLEQMIEELVRIGYLKPVAGDCNERCAGCPFPQGYLRIAAECAIGGSYQDLDGEGDKRGRGATVTRYFEQAVLS